MSLSPNIHNSCVIDNFVFFGLDTIVWQFTTICKGVKLGDHVVIGSNCWIGDFTEIGDNSRIQHGVFICRKTKIGKNVFIGPNVTFTDDKYPVVGNKECYNAQPPIIEDNVSIGAGVVILAGVTIKSGAMIGAGAILTKDVDCDEVIVGNPGRLIG